MKKIKYWLLVLLCGIAYFSHQPFHQQDISPYIEKAEILTQTVRQLPQIQFSYNNAIIDSQGNTVGFIQFLLRKLAHLCLYGLLGISLLLTTRDMDDDKIKQWIIVGIIVFVVASADEVNQLFSSGRTGCKEDIVMDFTGYVLFSIVYFIINKFRKGSLRG